MKKHIVCFGDSNTHGFCADPQDCADHGNRFNEDERWTQLLQKSLGENYLVLEEGMSGRTTVFQDALHEGRSGLDYIFPCLESHEPVDLLIIMLGTNDTKARFGVNAACIGTGMERLVLKAKGMQVWRNGKPNILVIAPPHIGEGLYNHPLGLSMGEGSPEKSKEVASFYADLAERQGCAFLDAEGLAEINQLDCVHLTRKGHAALAAHLASIVPTLVGEQ